jgi:hypothetical protein
MEWNGVLELVRQCSAVEYCRGAVVQWSGVLELVRQRSGVLRWGAVGCGGVQNCNEAVEQ